MLGIVWGIAAVIVLVAVVSGFHREFAGSLDERTTRLISVTVDRSQVTSERNWKLWPSDVDSVLNQVGLVEWGTAESGAGRVVMQRGSESRSVSPRGVFPEYLDSGGVRLGKGRFVNNLDNRDHSRTLVLGYDLAEGLFATEEPVGSTVRLGRWDFLVVGVLAKKDGMWSGASYDRSAIIPFSTLSHFFTGTEEANSLVFRVRAGADDLAAVFSIESTLLTKKGVPVGQHPFRLYNAAERFRQTNRLIAGAKILVGVVGSITLLVAVVGVANIMLVSVAERTPEIGLRKAVGATRAAIMWQFLAEALVLCGLGWVAGVFWGILLTKLAAMLPISGFPPPHVSLTNVLVSGLLILFSGLLAGFLPAVRAARLPPNEALRQE